MKRVISIVIFFAMLVFVAVIETLGEQIRRDAAASFEMSRAWWATNGMVLAVGFVLAVSLWIVNRYGAQSRGVSAVFVVVGLVIWLASTPPVAHLWALMHPEQFPRTVLGSLSALPESLLTVAAALFAVVGVLNLLSPLDVERESSAD